MQGTVLFQLVRATNMVVSSLRFMKAFRANVLEPDVYHLNPAKSDNMQFRKFVRYNQLNLKLTQ